MGWLAGSQTGRRRSALASGRSESNAPKRKHKPDYMLIALALALLIIGLIVIYSISPGLSVQRHVSENYYIEKQLIAIGMGIVAFIGLSTIPLSYWKRVQMPLIAVAAVATLITLILPLSPDYPAHRWIRFGGGLSFQSVELIKFAIIFVFSTFLIQRIKEGTLNDSQKTFKPLLIVLVVLGVVVAKLQSDLGSTAVLVAMMTAMAYVAGLPLKRIVIFGGIILIGGILAISTTAYRRDRLLTFLHPEQDCQTTGYQACQALIAVGSGGVIGKGLGQSVQAYGYLPEAANDSIFAIYAEKFGFVGVTIFIVLFTVLFARLRMIMERAPDMYSRLVIAGILAWFSTQVIINVGAMLGLLPLKGITLPFVSYGGTSIIFVMAALGLAYNISRQTTFTVNTDIDEGGGYEDSADRRRNRRPYYAYSSRRT